MGSDFENARTDPTAMADRARDEVEARRVEGAAAARERTDRAAVREDREAMMEEGEEGKRKVRGRVEL